MCYNTVRRSTGCAPTSNPLKTTVTTLAEVARRVGVNYHTLRLWAKHAGLRTTRLGNYVLFDIEDVERLVASKRKA